MDLFMELLVSLLLILGVVFSLGGAVGLIRFPDTYTRMHALSKSVTLGIILLMTAGLVFFVWSGVGFSQKNFLVIIFLLLTVPIGSHMIGRAAYHAGNSLCNETTRDDLAEDCERIYIENPDL